MRPVHLRRTLLPLLALAGACAHVEPPPGGPEDRTPPGLATVVPESLTVVPGWREPVVLRFDERISEQGAEDAVMVSPRTSPVLVDRGRSELRVSLRDGWQPGIVYHVTVGSGLRDLFNNSLVTPISVVFSTGPAIPATLAAGEVVDRITGRPEVNLRVEAIRQADSLVYAVPSDSAGRFTFAHVPEGSYLLRAYRDVNRNRSLEPYEARDSALLEIGEQIPDPGTRLAVVDPDTIPPRVTSAVATLDGGIELRFDDYLDPAQTLSPSAVQIVGPDGASVAVAGVNPQGAAAAVTTLPSQTLAVELAEGAALAPETTYRVLVRGVLNVVGLPGDSEIELETPPAPPPAAPAGEPDEPENAPGAPGV